MNHSDSNHDYFKYFKYSFRFIFALLSSVCIGSALSPVLSAATVDDLTFTLINGDTEYSVSDILPGASGEIVIPSEHNGKPVTAIGSAAFQGCRVKNINLPQGVTVLEEMVFSGCDRLESINIEGSLSSIGEGSFRESGLVRISLPESLTSIKNLAFAYCSKLYSMTFDGVAPELGDSVFAKTGHITVLCKEEYLDSFRPWEKLPDANITVEVRDEASISAMRKMYRDMHRDAYRHCERQPEKKKGIRKRKLFKFPNCCG